MNKYNHLICTLRKQMLEEKKEFCFSVMPTRYDVSTANISFECSLSWLPFSWAFAASFHFVRSFYSIHASYNRAAPYDCFIFPIAPVCMCLTTFPFGRCSCYSGQFFLHWNRLHLKHSLNIIIIDFLKAFVQYIAFANRILQMARHWKN